MKGNDSPKRKRRGTKPGEYALGRARRQKLERVLAALRKGETAYWNERGVRWKLLPCTETDKYGNGDFLVYAHGRIGIDLVYEHKNKSAFSSDRFGEIDPDKILAVAVNLEKRPRDPGLSRAAHEILKERFGENYESPNVREKHADEWALLEHVQQYEGGKTIAGNGHTSTLIQREVVFRDGSKGSFWSCYCYYSRKTWILADSPPGEWWKLDESVHGKNKYLPISRWPVPKPQEKLLRKELYRRWRRREEKEKAIEEVLRLFDIKPVSEFHYSWELASEDKEKVRLLAREMFDGFLKKDT